MVMRLSDKVLDKNYVQFRCVNDATTVCMAVTSYTELPERYHGCSTASDSRCVLVQRMLQWMAVHCHDSIPSTTDTKVHENAR